MYPNQDNIILEEGKENKTVRIGLTESIINLKYTPCFLLINQIPLLYSVWQAGANCGFASSEHNTITFQLMPEIQIDDRKNQFAINLGIYDSFDLTQGRREWLLSAGMNYKFWDNKLKSSSYNLDTRQLLQLWGSVFDSNILLGFVYNDEEGAREGKNKFSSLFYYKQSLPLEWRQIGGQTETASVEYKALGVSFRKEAYNFLVFGLGIAYWVFTFDGIRISGPLPELYLAVDI